jgi:hypothetical protein
MSEITPAEDSPGRGKNGRFVRSLDTARKDALAAELRARGMPLWEIAGKLGYSNESGASKAIARALAAVPAEGVAELRALECERLDQLTRQLFTLLDTKYPLLIPGRELVDQNGAPVADPGPILAVVDRLMRISQRRARLLGLDAPVKRETEELTQPARGALELTAGHLELLRALLTGLALESAEPLALLALPVAAETPGEAA